MPDVNLSYQLLESMDSQWTCLLVAVKKDKILITRTCCQAGRRRWWWITMRLGLQNCFEVNYDPDRGKRWLY